MSSYSLRARRAAAVRWGHDQEARELGSRMAAARIEAAVLDYRRKYGSFDEAARRRLRVFIDGLPPPGF